MSTIGNRTIAVTLTAKHPHVTVAGHIDGFGSGPSTILNDGVSGAMIATGMYAQSGGLANNAGTITAATRGIVVNDRGEAYNTGLILAGTSGDDLRPVGIPAPNASVADNAGTLTSAFYGIVLTNGAHAYNTGTISCHVFAIYENQPNSEYIYADNSGVITRNESHHRRPHHRLRTHRALPCRPHHEWQRRRR